MHYLLVNDAVLLYSSAAVEDAGVQFLPHDVSKSMATTSEVIYCK